MGACAQEGHQHTGAMVLPRPGCCSRSAAHQAGSRLATSYGQTHRARWAVRLDRGPRDGGRPWPGPVPISSPAVRERGSTAGARRAGQAHPSRNRGPLGVLCAGRRGALQAAALSIASASRRTCDDGRLNAAPPPETARRTEQCSARGAAAQGLDAQSCHPAVANPLWQATPGRSSAAGLPGCGDCSCGRCVR